MVAEVCNVMLLLRLVGALTLVSRPGCHQRLAGGSCDVGRRSRIVSTLELLSTAPVPMTIARPPEPMLLPHALMGLLLQGACHWGSSGRCERLRVWAGTRPRPAGAVDDTSRPRRELGCRDVHGGCELVGVVREGLHSWRGHSGMTAGRCGGHRPLLLVGRRRGHPDRCG